MKKRYLNALILAILILAPLAYAITPTQSKTITTTTTEATTEGSTPEATVTPQEYPYGPPNEPVYYMDWDWSDEELMEAGDINYVFTYKGNVYILTWYTIQQITGNKWARGLLGSLIYYWATKDEYYVYDSFYGELYVYDLTTGELLYEGIPAPYAYMYRVGDFVATNGLLDVVSYDYMTGYLYITTITGAYVTTLDLITFTGAYDCMPLYYIGDDFFAEYAGAEIVLYTVYQTPALTYNVSLDILSFENVTDPAIVASEWVAVNIDDYGGGVLWDVNGDGVEEALIFYENNSKIWLATYNITEGAFDLISKIGLDISYYYTEPYFFWVNNFVFWAIYNGSHIAIANITSGDLWEYEVPTKYTEGTYDVLVTGGYVNDTLIAAIFADKMDTATNDPGLLKLYVVNITDGSEIWNITLGEDKYFSGYWYIGSTTDSILIINYYGPYFVVTLADGKVTIDGIPTVDYYYYDIDEVPGTNYWFGIGEVLYFSIYGAGYQVVRFTTDGAIDFGFVEMPIHYEGLPAFDYDDDGNVETLVVADAYGYSYGYTYYWFDLDDLVLEDIFGFEGMRDDFKVWDMLAVDPEGTLALIKAKNYTEGVWYFGWFNWTTGEWYNALEDFSFGVYGWLSDDVIVCTYYNVTSGEMYLAKMNITSLEILAEFNLDAYYVDTYSYEFSIMLADMNDDGADDVVLIPMDTGDSLIMVFDASLNYLFSYTLFDAYIQMYGTLDLDNDGELEYYFVTEDYIIFFDTIGLEYVGAYNYGNYGSLYNIFVVRIPGYGDGLVVAYDDDYIDIVYYDAYYDEIYSLAFWMEYLWGYLDGRLLVGMVEAVWMAGDGSKLVAVTSTWEAVTINLEDFPYYAYVVDSIDIFWPLWIDLYPYAYYWYFFIPDIYSAWFDGDILYLVIGNSWFFDDNMEYFNTAFMVVYYLPDYNAPGAVTVQDVYVAGEVIEFTYGASDDLWLGYIYITVEYTLIDGSTVTIPVAEQPAYYFGNSYYSSLIITLPPDIRDYIVEADITIMVTDLIWLYYDYIGGIDTGHYAYAYAFFLIDLEAPELFVSYPVNGSSFTLSKADELVISVQVSENSFTYGYPVEVLINVNNKYAFYVTTYGDFVVSIPAEALVEGTNTIVIKATDIAGNVATITIVVNVTFEEPAEEAASAAAEASINSMIAGIIAVLVALLALGIAAIRRS